MAPFKFDGTNQMCIPQNASSLVVYYNADLFEDAEARLTRRPAGSGRSSSRTR